MQSTRTRPDAETALQYYVLKGISARTVKVGACQIEAEVNASTCVPAGRCVPVGLKVDAYQAKYATKAKLACLPVPIDQVLEWVQGAGYSNVFIQALGACGATTVDEMIDCVFERARCAAEREVGRIDPRAQDTLAFDGSGAAFPCVGLP